MSNKNGGISGLPLFSLHSIIQRLAPLTDILGYTMLCMFHRARVTFSRFPQSLNLTTDQVPTTVARLFHTRPKSTSMTPLMHTTMLNQPSFTSLVECSYKHAPPTLFRSFPVTMGSLTMTTRRNMSNVRFMEKIVKSLARPYIKMTFYTTILAAIVTAYSYFNFFAVIAEKYGKIKEFGSKLRNDMKGKLGKIHADLREKKDKLKEKQEDIKSHSKEHLMDQKASFMTQRDIFVEKNENLKKKFMEKNEKLKKKLAEKHVENNIFGNIQEKSADLKENFQHKKDDFKSHIKQKKEDWKTRKKSNRSQQDDDDV